MEVKHCFVHFHTTVMRLYIVLSFNLIFLILNLSNTCYKTIYTMLMRVMILYKTLLRQVSFVIIDGQPKHKYERKVAINAKQ